MTKGLLISRNNKLTLHKKAPANPNLFYNSYKLYRNVFNRIIRASKQMYLDDNFKKYQKNPKKTWDLLKETAFGTKTSIDIKEITSNGKSTNDPTEMANIFNKFFAEIGKKISDSVQQPEKQADEYIPNYDPNKPTFSFDHTGPVHLCDIVKSFDNKMSPDLDGLSLQLIKFIISDINIPLSHIFNLSFDTGIFPEKLKRVSYSSYF